MTLLAVELPRPLQPLNWVARLVVVGTVEPRVRAAYGLSWTRRDRLAFDALARASRTLRPVTPRRVATGRLTPLGNALLPYAEARLPPPPVLAVRLRHAPPTPPDRPDPTCRRTVHASRQLPPVRR